SDRPSSPRERAPGEEHEERADEGADQPGRTDPEALIAEEAPQGAADERADEPGDERLAVRTRAHAEDQLCEPAHGHAEHEDGEDQHGAPRRGAPKTDTVIRRP